MISSSNEKQQCTSAPDQSLLPILKHALPTILSYTIPSNSKVVQANAEGTPILARHTSSTLPEVEEQTTLSEHHGEETAVEKDSRLLVTTNNKDDDNASEDIEEETELFLKRVTASSYTHKSWTDMRRTLVYLRTEVRFYNEIVPLLLLNNNGEKNNDSEGCNTLQKHLPIVHHATYNLDGLISEDCPTTNAKQPSPFSEDDDSNEESSTQKQLLLQEKGGHILLQSLSATHGYFQNSPISKEQALQCLVAVANLHASAWGNTKLLQTIHDELSSAGGSYQLSFRNPKELQNVVASWEYFMSQFNGMDDDSTANILNKESITKLGQRVYDMAEYVSNELSPSVEDEYATIVHGDYKAMNVFLPINDETNGGAVDGDAIMIDFSCAGIGLGMSDVGMHIVHAVLPHDLENGGEEWLIEGYLTALEDAMNGKAGMCAEDGGKKWTYPRDIAMRHYQLACVDYLRFIMGRFWRSATPEAFEKKKASKNTTLINRNLESALTFIQKVDKYLEVFEKEKKDREGA